MLLVEGLDSNDKLIKEIVKVNLKFGKYHLLPELNEQSAMLARTLHLGIIKIQPVIPHRCHGQ